jgi:hypothetical protein
LRGGATIHQPSYRLSTVSGWLGNEHRRRCEIPACRLLTAVARPGGSRRLPGKRRRDGAELRGRLETLGIFRGSGHEHLAGSLVIPVLDEAGNVSEVYGRKVRDDLRAGTPRHLYLPGPHRGVWNLPAVAASGR